MEAQLVNHMPQWDYAKDWRYTCHWRTVQSEEWYLLRINMLLSAQEGWEEKRERHPAGNLTVI
jgi:hypothetical protein